MCRLLFPTRLRKQIMTQTSLSYRDAGVDIDAGDQLVENIKPFAKRTMRPEVLGDLGGFGALVEISKKIPKSRAGVWQRTALVRN